VLTTAIILQPSPGRRAFRIKRDKHGSHILMFFKDAIFNTDIPFVGQNGTHFGCRLKGDASHHGTHRRFVEE